MFFLHFLGLFRCLLHPAVGRPAFTGTVFFLPPATELLQFLSAHPASVVVLTPDLVIQADESAITAESVGLAEQFYPVQPQIQALCDSPVSDSLHPHSADHFFLDFRHVLFSSFPGCAPNISIPTRASPNGYLRILNQRKNGKMPSLSLFLCAKPAFYRELL